ncbi:hypothetical protein HJG60_001692 [Phyllostomus discolor]|uniref:Uncharacterized protein n=1 Tax=Phyllostomus discolor TaxID=89673 RepID=A0A833YJF2_9CHIR|nr:hypothetical protein HJG60_001692 [Phyllostomus discolor]
MDSAGTEKRPGAQEGTAEGAAQFTEAPGDHAQGCECPGMRSQGLVSAPEACGTQGEDKCPTAPVSEPELQEERLKLEEESLKPEVEAPEERGPRPVASVLRSSHGPKRKPVKKGPAPTAPVPVHQLLQP